MKHDWLVPDWPAPGKVHALVTTRRGGVSLTPYDSMNLGAHVGDEDDAVRRNRERLSACLPTPPVWLEQVHGTEVIDITGHREEGSPAPGDAAIATEAGRVCAVMTADCLPVLLCDRAGEVVAAAHAGWRGLCAGVLEETVARMGRPGKELLAWLGPAIGPAAFEVGEEVRRAFVMRDGRAQQAFAPAASQGKWLADLFMLARIRLASAGVESVYGGGICTVTDAERFYSYRRDGVTGRFASLIWLNP